MSLLSATSRSTLLSRVQAFASKLVLTAGQAASRKRSKRKLRVGDVVFVGRLGTLMVALLCGLLPGHPAQAAMVKLLTPQSLSVTVGERLPVSVVLLAQGQFSGPTYFDLPEIDGAILLQISTRPVLASEEIDGVSHVSASHDFIFYAQRGGTFKVPPITARFSSKSGHDQPAVEHRLRTESFTVSAKAPAGAIGGELIVSTREFKAAEIWSPQPSQLKVGDAFTRAITVRAAEVPAMLLPAIDFGKVDGFAIYPKPPQLKDQSERGEFVGERIDAASYVTNKAGSFEVPELNLRWWDPDKEQWQSQTFPALTLEVAANPALALTSIRHRDASETFAGWKLWFGSLAILLIVVLLALFAGPRVQRHWRAWHTRREASEALQWKRLSTACRSGDAAKIHHELNRWLAHFAMSTFELTMGASDNANEPLRAACIALQEQLVEPDAKWDRSRLSAELRSLRRRLLLPGQADAVSRLPPLNPQPASRNGRQRQVPSSHGI